MSDSQPQITNLAEAEAYILENIDDPLFKYYQLPEAFVAKYKDRLGDYIKHHKKVDLQEMEDRQAQLEAIKVSQPQLSIKGKPKSTKVQQPKSTKVVKSNSA